MGENSVTWSKKPKEMHNIKRVLDEEEDKQKKKKKKRDYSIK
jgi:hypothetical protein